MAQTYVTNDSDTLWDIAARFYGDGAQWPAIHQANQDVIGGDPNVIYGGMTLTIPDLATIRQQVGGGQLYITTDSDTLSDIASRFYGDGNRWPEIYRANQAAIGADPNVIRGGIQLTIP